MPTAYYLILSFVLFLIGTAGVLLRRNALIVLMGIELQLNGGNLALLAFSRAARRSEGARLRVPRHRAGRGRGGGRPGDPGRPVPQPPDHQPRRSHADEALTESDAAMTLQLFASSRCCPFLGAALLMLFGRKWLRATWVHIVATLAIGASCLVVARRLLRLRCPRRARPGGLRDVVWTWIASGDLKVDLALPAGRAVRA